MNLRRLLPLALLFSSALAQTPEKPNVPPPDPSGDAGLHTERKISQEEAQELFKNVDQLLQFVNKATKLPIKSEVKSQVADRESVQKYVEEKMAEDEDQKRLERAEVVLKKFGLLPREFKLRAFMVDVLKEQVAGFYDSKKKTMFLLDWMAPEAQKPVMAHELTHALQDQTVDLDGWVKEVRDKAKRSANKDAAEAESDEEIGARTAVLEGQGMAVLIDYILAPSGHSVEDSAQIVEAMKLNMSASDNSPVLNKAPLLIRESLIFPYRDGLGFVQALLANGGKDKAYWRALKNPPKDTRHILQPKSYLSGDDVDPMMLPDLTKSLGKNYQRYDSGSIGEFDVMVLLKEFSGPVDSKRLSPDWRGGIYFAARKKSAKKDEDLTTADIGIVYLSRWASPESAKKFSDIYADSLKRKYQSAVSNGRLWNTNEGPVSIEVMGDQILVLEGFDSDTAAKIRKSVVDMMKSGKGKAVASTSLGMKVAAPIYAVHQELFQTSTR